MLLDLERIGTLDDDRLDRAGEQLGVVDVGAFQLEPERTAGPLDDQALLAAGFASISGIRPLFPNLLQVPWAIVCSVVGCQARPDDVLTEADDQSIPSTMRALTFLCVFAPAARGRADCLRRTRWRGADAPLPAQRSSSPSRCWKRLAERDPRWSNGRDHPRNVQERPNKGVSS